MNQSRRTKNNKFFVMREIDSITEDIALLKCGHKVILLERDYSTLTKKLMVRKHRPVTTACFECGKIHSTKPRHTNI
jgi:hypothetical protein